MKLYLGCKNLLEIRITLKIFSACTTIINRDDDERSLHNKNMIDQVYFKSITRFEKIDQYLFRREKKSKPKTK